jgi:hypothetical protein
MTLSRFTLAMSLVAPLAACSLGERALSGECPRGEVCAPQTPDGLDFEGASLTDVFLDFGPHPTLAGGTQAIHLSYSKAGGAFRPLDLPYLADDGGGRGVKVERTDGPIVTLRGVAGRTNHLRITDPGGNLFDRKELAGASLTEIRIVPRRSETVAPGEAIVFAPGKLEVTVALQGETDGAPRRAVDESMAIALPGATRIAWDTLRLPAAAVGFYPLTVTAGDRPEATLEVEVVTGADALVLQPPSAPLAVAQLATVCFSAHAAGRHVAGLSWTFETDNGTAGASLFANCAAVAPKQAGPLTLTARAGGKTLAVAFTVQAQARRSDAAVDPRPVAGSPAGERAAMSEAALAEAAEAEAAEAEAAE